MAAVQIPKTIHGVTENFALSGFSPADESKRPREIDLPLSPGYVVQRTTDPPFLGSAPFASSIDYVHHYWANDREVLPGGAHHFTDAIDNPLATASTQISLQESGVRFPLGRFAGGGYFVGSRHYFEEGIFILRQPSTRFFFGYHDAQRPRGQLTIENQFPFSGPAIPRWTQAGLSGQPNVEFDFQELAFSISPFSPTVPAVPHYYHFARNYDPSTDRMLIDLSIDGAAAPQRAFQGLYNPESGGDQYFGSTTTLVLAREITMPWMRAAYSDAQIGAPVGNSPWLTPRLFDQQVYQSHGDYPNGWFDSGIVDRYWTHLRFHDLRHRFGSTLQFRVVATNTVPAGDLTSLWDGRQWIEAEPGGSHALYDSVLGWPQGRYLLTQLRWTPSPFVNLSGATSYFLEDTTGYVMGAFANTEQPPAPAPGGDPISITIGGEGDATAVLPVRPQYLYRKVRARPVSQRRMELPYVQSFALATKTRDEWAVRWNAITGAEKSALETFFLARGGGREAFLWLPEDAPTQSKATLVEESVTFQMLGPDVWRSEEVTFLEAF